MFFLASSCHFSAPRYQHFSFELATGWHEDPIFFDKPSFFFPKTSIGDANPSCGVHLQWIGLQENLQAPQVFPPKYRAKTCGFPAKAPPHASPLRRGSRGDPLLPPCAPSLRLEGAAGPWRYSKQCRDNLGKLKPTEICAGCIVLPCVDSWKEWVIFDGMDGYAPADLHIRAHVCKYICVCVNCFFYWNLVPQTS